MKKIIAMDLDGNLLKGPRIIDRIEIVWLGGYSLLQNKNDEFNFRQDIKAVQTVRI